MRHTFSFIADTFNTDRKRPAEHCNKVFQKAIQGLLPQMDRDPITINTNDIHYEALQACQIKYYKGRDTAVFIAGSYHSSPVRTWEVMDTCVIVKCSHSDYMGYSHTI